MASVTRRDGQGPPAPLKRVTDVSRLTVSLFLSGYVLLHTPPPPASPLSIYSGTAVRSVDFGHLSLVEGHRIYDSVGAHPSTAQNVLEGFLEAPLPATGRKGGASAEARRGRDAGTRGPSPTERTEVQ